MQIQEVIDRTISAGREQATMVLERLQSNRIRDDIAPVGAGQDAAPSLTWDGDNVGMIVAPGQEVRALHRNAQQQLGDKLGIHPKFIRDSVNGEAWQRELIADVMNTHIANSSRQRLLVRSVGPQVRAVLSDQYRRTDSAQLVNGFAGAAERLGALPYRATGDELQWSVSIMLPTALEIPMGPHGIEHIAAAVHLRGSDFGASATELCAEFLRLWCTNGAISASAMRQVHLGRRLPDDLGVTQRTYQLDSEAQASAIRDLTGNLLKLDFIKGRMAQAQEAAEDRVDAQEHVQGLVKARRIEKGEGADVLAALASGDPQKVPEGPSTRYSMGQALAWVAQGRANSRRTELERLAAGIMGLS